MASGVSRLKHRPGATILTGGFYKSPPADDVIEQDGIREFASVSFQLFHVPGHTPGGMCLYAFSDGDGGATLFSGDTLFAGSIGRTDFPGGEHATLVRCIREKLFALPDNTIVYPGHGPSTTIRRERDTNPFPSGG